jgi:hypothetical protein
MSAPQTLVVRTFADRSEGLSHFILRAGEAPRLLAFDDALGCPLETQNGRRFVYLGPRLDAPPMDVFEGAVLFDEPGVKAVEFSQRAHGLAHFLRATSGAGALIALLGRRAPEIRHLRRWLGPVIKELDVPRPLVAGWFAATAAGCLFGPTESEPNYRYIEAGLES